MYDDNSIHISLRGPCLLFFNISIASDTSRELPILLPSGIDIFVRRQITFILFDEPISIINLANFLASSRFFIKAPLPTLISNTSFLAPRAIFLLIIEEAIRGIDSTVAVTSLRAYIFLSATAISFVWLVIATLIVLI